MSDRGPSSDSYKAPLVLLSLGSAETLRDTRFLPGEPTPGNVVPDVLSSRIAGQGLFLNCWDFVESFEYGFDDDAAWVARFTLFDKFFDYLLPRFIVARENQQRVFVFFQFGWIADGPTVRMSEPRAGVVVQATPMFLQDGVRIELEVQAPETFIKSVEKASARWPDGTPAHVIAKQAIEMPHPTVSNLNRGIDPPRVLTPVPCEPVVNNGDGILMEKEYPISWVRNWLLERAIPVERKYRDRPMKLFESNSEQGTMIFAPEGWREGPVEIKRVYHVGRGQSPNVIEFAPSDNTEIANQLGGEGYMRAVTGEKLIKQEDRNSVSADSTNQSTTDKTADRFTRMSFARSPGELSQERTRRWAQAQALATQATMTVVGDPHIELNDYVEVRCYKGGTLSAAGVPHPDGYRADGPQLLPLVSGQYVVLGYNHQISGGRYVTSMKLVRAQQQQLRANPDSPDLSDDSVSTGPVPDRNTVARTSDEVVE